MTTYDYQVHSSQTSAFVHLPKLIVRYANTQYLRPISSIQQAAFQNAHEWVSKNNKPIILDSGCGRGDSTLFLARQFPDFAIVGVDKSTHRLEHYSREQKSTWPTNLLLVRANLFDFFRQALAHKWPIEQHYILYPNPWPKNEHIKRRFYGHPTLKTLLSLSPKTIVRSNWLLYLQEFALAAKLINGLDYAPKLITPNPPISAFEKKYAAANCPVYELVV